MDLGPDYSGYEGPIPMVGWMGPKKFNQNCDCDYCLWAKGRYEEWQAKKKEKVTKYLNENPFEKLHAGEPWFFLRAQDKLSIQALQEYKHLLYVEGLDEASDSIWDLMQEFAKWQKKNPDKVKLPD